MTGGEYYRLMQARPEKKPPEWMRYGPNGRVVAAFIDALRTLDVPAWYAARYAAQDAAGDAARDVAWDAARDAAWYAARYAACALVVADLITPEQLATLYAPFEQVFPIKELRQRAIAMFPMEALK